MKTLSYINSTIEDIIVGKKNIILDSYGTATGVILKGTNY
jgi:hypothetical protein